VPFQDHKWLQHEQTATHLLCSSMKCIVYLIYQATKLPIGITHVIPVYPQGWCSTCLVVQRLQPAATK
jgi:hypothetical protein